jgi:hypothetical protein
MQNKYLITLLTSLLFSLSACADSSNTDSSSTSILVPSSWVNQDSSTLSITSVDSTGQITGIYINGAAGYNCQNIVYPVTGWIYGTAITFDTKWESTIESCNSITSWAGFLYQGEISTFWNLTLNGSTSTSQIIQGKDTFTQITTSVKTSLISKT